MKVAINRHGVVGIIGAPHALRAELTHWFGVKTGPDGTLILPKHKVLAFLNHYKCEVDPRLTAWIEEAYSPNQVLRRMPAHIRSWKGGYQGPLIAKAIGRKRQALFARYGAGKTIMLLEIARQLGPTILIVPPMVWANAYVLDEPAQKGDLVRFYRGLRVIEAMGGGDKEARAGMLRHPADIYAISSSIVGSLVPELLDIPCACIEIDESTLMKNEKTEVFRAARRLRHKTPYRFVASGDMSPTNIGELWPQIDWLDPQILGERHQFNKEYGERDANGWGWVFDDEKKNVECLNKLAHEHQVITFLPEKKFYGERKTPVIRRVPVTLGREQMGAYRSMETHFRLRTANDETIDADSKLSSAMKLRQLTAGFVYDASGKPHQAVKVPAKIAALKKLATTTAPNGFSGEQAIIWCHFTHEYTMVARALRELGITSGVMRGRDIASMAAMKKFVNGQIQCLLTHQKTAAHGMRFHHCRHAVYMSLDWSSERFHQSRARIDRPPQQHRCYFWMLAARDTIDEHILAVLEGRTNWRQLVERVLTGNHRHVAAEERRNERPASA